VRDLELLPQLVDMGEHANTGTFVAGLGLCALGLLLLGWRVSHSRTTSRRASPENPAHVPPKVQRFGDILLPAAIALGGLGAADADFGWAIGSLGVAIAWAVAVLAFGVGVERAHPELPHTAATLLDKDPPEATP
jgi:hypothetical protein